MEWNDHEPILDHEPIQEAVDETLSEFRAQLYRVADALCALRPSQEAGPEEFTVGLLKCLELKHPVLSTDGQMLEDIPLPALGGVFDPTILNKAAFTRAANLLFFLADHLSWFESDDREEDDE